MFEISTVISSILLFIFNETLMGINLQIKSLRSGEFLRRTSAIKSVRKIAYA